MNKASKQSAVQEPPDEERMKKDNKREQMEE